MEVVSCVPLFRHVDPFLKFPSIQGSLGRPLFSSFPLGIYYHPPSPTFLLCFPFYPWVLTPSNLSLVAFRVIMHVSVPFSHPRRSLFSPSMSSALFFFALVKLLHVTRCPCLVECTLLKPGQNHLSLFNPTLWSSVSAFDQ